MNRYLFYFILISIFICSCHQEEKIDPNIILNQCYSDRDINIAYHGIQTEKKNIFLVGRCATGRNWDAFICKVDSSGKKIWWKNYGGKGVDKFLSIAEAEKSLIVVGSKNGYLWAIKITPDGHTIWEKNWGKGQITCICKINPQHFVLVGEKVTKTRDLWLCKLDSTGNKLWEKIFRNKDINRAHSIALCKDSGFVIAGKTRAQKNSNLDAWIIRTDSKGKKLWDRTYGKKGWDEALDIKETSKGDFLIVGSQEKANQIKTTTDPQNYKAWIFRVDKKGKKLWEKIIDKPGMGRLSKLQSIDSTTFIAVGLTGSKRNTDAWIVKIQENGKILSQKKYGGRGQEGFYSIEKTKQNKYIIAGTTTSYGKDKMNAWFLYLDK